MSMHRKIKSSATVGVVTEELSFAAKEKGIFTEKRNRLQRKFGLYSNRPKTVLRTNSSVYLTEKSVVPTDFDFCLKKLKVVKTANKISCENRFVDQGNR
jgi:hypothetical protein